MSKSISGKAAANGSAKSTTNGSSKSKASSVAENEPPKKKQKTMDAFVKKK